MFRTKQMWIHVHKIDLHRKRDHFGVSVVMVTTKRQNMASLLSEKLFETAGQGPPPNKDFYQLVITQKEVFRCTWIDYYSGIIIRDKYLNVVVNFCITCIAKNKCLSYLIS